MKNIKLSREAWILIAFFVAGLALWIAFNYFNPNAGNSANLNSNTDASPTSPRTNANQNPSNLSLNPSPTGIANSSDSLLDQPPPSNNITLNLSPTSEGSLLGNTPLAPATDDPSNGLGLVMVDDTATNMVDVSVDANTLDLTVATDANVVDANITDTNASSPNVVDNNNTTFSQNAVLT